MISRTMGWFNWFAKDESREVNDKEEIVLTGTNNLITTEHVQHLQYISFGIGLLCIIFVVGGIFIKVVHQGL